MNMTMIEPSTKILPCGRYRAVVLDTTARAPVWECSHKHVYRSHRAATYHAGHTTYPSGALECAKQHVARLASHTNEKDAFVASFLQAHKVAREHIPVITDAPAPAQLVCACGLVQSALSLSHAQDIWINHLAYAMVTEQYS